MSAASQRGRLRGRLGGWLARVVVVALEDAPQMLGAKWLLQRIEHLQPVPRANRRDVVQKLGLLAADQLDRASEAALAQDADAVDRIGAVERHVQEDDRWMRLFQRARQGSRT